MRTAENDGNGGNAAICQRENGGGIENERNGKNDRDEWIWPGYRPGHFYSAGKYLCAKNSKAA